jgi:hypothetical protein
MAVFHQHPCWSLWRGGPMMGMVVLLMMHIRFGMMGVVRHLRLMPTIVTLTKIGDFGNSILPQDNRNDMRC